METPGQRPERLELGQNLYDQPEFAKIRTLTAQFDHPVNLYSCIFLLSHTYHRVLAQELTGVLDYDPSEDYVALNRDPNTADMVLKNLISRYNNFPINLYPYFKDETAYKLLPPGQKHINVSKMLKIIVEALPEPTHQLLYINSLHNFYLSSGEPNPTAPYSSNTHETPYTFSQWRQNVINHIDQIQYQGLGEITGEMGFVSEPTAPVGKGRVNAYYKELESTNTNRSVSQGEVIKQHLPTSVDE